MNDMEAKLKGVFFLKYAFLYIKIIYKNFLRALTSHNKRLDIGAVRSFGLPFAYRSSSIRRFNGVYYLYVRHYYRWGDSG